MSETDLTHLISDEMKHNLIVHLVSELGGSVSINAAQLDATENKILRVACSVDDEGDIVIEVADETTPY